MNRAPDLPTCVDADGKPIGVGIDNAARVLGVGIDDAAREDDELDDHGIEPDDVLKAINGACDNGLPFDLDGARVELEGFLFGRGRLLVVDEDDMVLARFAITLAPDRAEQMRGHCGIGGDYDETTPTAAGGDL